MSSPFTAVWRIAPGTEPLVRGAADGPLRRRAVAVKDLFAVAGQRIGGGNPDWLASAAVEPTHAAAVAALLAAGADVAGIAQTDELAFSLAGVNIHYGTPDNPAAPGRVVGGSSSGPAAAVAAGDADIGLGTDTAGSIRVPASYCSLYGLRTTHGAVDRSGLIGLAPSFDTVGVLTRTAAELAAAADALLPPAADDRTDEILVAPALMELATPATRAAVEAAVRAVAARAAVRVGAVDLDAAELNSWLDAFRTVQCAEAWREHGSFVTAHGDRMEPAIAARFRSGASVRPDDETAARTVLAGARAELRSLLRPGVVLALPSTSAPAPRVDAGTDAASVDAIRAATLRLTCLASLAGLPAVSLPVTGGQLPLGLSLVGAPNTDRSLVALAAPPPR